MTSEANPGLTAVSLNGEVVKEGRIIGLGEGGGLFVEQKEKESDGAREKIKELKDRLKKIKHEKDRTQTERKRLAEAASKSAQDLASLFENAR